MNRAPSLAELVGTLLQRANYPLADQRDDRGPVSITGRREEGVTDMLRTLTTAWCREVSGLVRVGAVLCLLAAAMHAQGNPDVVHGKATPPAPTAPPSLSSTAPLLPVDSSSPRATLATFLRLAQETEDTWRAYQTSQSHASYERLLQLRYSHGDRGENRCAFDADPGSQSHDHLRP